MSERDLEKLLGGFAADTLMPEERIRLYTAAMQDQQLFNALADEQALKELLADPQVRDRLLQAVRAPGTSNAGDPLSWWDWLRRPAGLAFAGGLAAVLFAVAFGTKIYQESLERAAHRVATENAPPVPAPQASSPPQPSAAEPVLKSKESMDSVSKSAKNDALADKSAERKRMSAPAAPQEQRTEQDVARKQAPKSPAPPAAASAPQARHAQAGAPALSTVAPTVSARAKFYESEPSSISASESAHEANRPGAKAERFTAAGGPQEGPPHPGR
ncbi:MAG: hypothetical protein ABI856_14975 [Nitrospira sp.]